MTKEEKLRFQGVEMQLQDGDIITSKKGILSQSPITKEWFLVYKTKHITLGRFEAIKKEKIPTEVKKI